MDSTSLPLVIGTIVVFAALTVGITYSNYNSVEVAPFRSSRFDITGNYDASTNEIKGVVENKTNRTFSYLEVKAKIYDANDVVMGKGRDTIRNFGPGEKYRFRIWFPSDINDVTGRIKFGVGV